MNHWAFGMCKSSVYTRGNENNKLCWAMDMNIGETLKEKVIDVRPKMQPFSTITVSRKRQKGLNISQSRKEEHFSVQFYCHDALEKRICIAYLDSPT